MITKETIEDLKGTLMGWDELLESEKEDLVGLIEHYLQSQTQDIIKRIEGMKKEYKKNTVDSEGDAMWADDVISYNQAIKDVLEKLDK